MKKILILLLFVLTFCEIFSQTDNVYPIIKSRSLGDFIIGANKTQKIAIDIDRAIFKKSEKPRVE